MLDRIGLNRAFLSNPITWLAVALLVVAGSSAVRADRHYDYTCALMAAIHSGGVNGDDYFVQPTDTLAYETCKGRVPTRFKNIWPLADCSPGGRPHFSDGSVAGLIQKCRRVSGNSWIY